MFATSILFHLKLWHLQSTSATRTYCSHIYNEVFLYIFKYEENRNIFNSCYYGEMLNVTKKNLIIIKSIIVWKWNHLFMKNYFWKKKINYCYGFIPGDFQFICCSMVGKNCWSQASTKTPAFELARGKYMDTEYDYN